MRLKWFYFSQMSFHLICQIFLAENHKNFKVGKILKFDEETKYFEKKKRFHPLKIIFNEMGRRKKLPVVAVVLLFCAIFFRIW